MVKFLDILKEIYINEGIVKVPQEILDKSKEIFNYIKSHLEDLKSKPELKKGGEDSVYLDSKFKDYFKLKDLKGQDIKISIGFYSDPKAGGAFYNDNIVGFNLYFPMDKEFVEDTIEHEIVHAMDPKLRDMRIRYGEYDEKTGKYKGGVERKGGYYGGSKLNVSKSGEKSEFDKNYEKYIKAPWEFDAFTAPLINKLTFNIKKSPKYRDTLLNLLSDIKSKSIEDILADEKYTQMPWYFSKKEWKSENYPAVKQEYTSDLRRMKIWSSKPTLYKRFTSRLGKELI